MQGAVLHGARDIRFEDRAEPTIIEPTDAIISLPATCVCGSDLWPYRGIQAFPQPVPMGHEYCGIVEEVGRKVTSIKRGQFVIGSFFASDNTCPNCRAGYQTSRVHKEYVVGAQAPRLRVPLADGTLVPTRERPEDGQTASLLALSDVMGTGWFAGEAANVRPGGSIGYVGVPHGVTLDGADLFYRHVHLHGGGSGQEIPAAPDRSGAQRHDRPGQGVRSRAAACSSCRRLPRHGRAPRDQSAAAPLNHAQSPNWRHFDGHHTSRFTALGKGPRRLVHRNVADRSAVPGTGTGTRVWSRCDV
jgi:threonine dehydrogenase-like Zn-dependent dehydrogenase